MGNGLWFRVGFVLDKALLRFEDLAASEGCVAPALNFDALAFEVLVDGEEVGDLLEHVRIDLGEVPDILVARIVFADGEHLFVGEALVEHLEHANGTDFHHAAGEAGCVDQHETVQRVAIRGEGAGDKTVVARIVNRRVKIAIQPEDMQFLVVLVLVDSFVGDLDDRIDNLRTVGACGEFQVVRHEFRSLFSLENNLNRGAMLVGGRLVALGRYVMDGHTIVKGQKRHLVYNQTR